MPRRSRQFFVHVTDPITVGVRQQVHENLSAARVLTGRGPERHLLVFMPLGFAAGTFADLFEQTQLQRLVGRGLAERQRPTSSLNVVGHQRSSGHALLQIPRLQNPIAVFILPVLGVTSHTNLAARCGAQAAQGSGYRQGS